MKFTVDRDALLRPLQLLAGVVERRQTLQVLANVLIVAKGSTVEIVGTDLEVELHVRVENVRVEQEGSTTLPTRKLGDIFRSFGEGAQVSVQLEADRSIVRSGRSRFVLATLPAADFPRTGGGVADFSLVLSQTDVRSLIDRVSFAMAQQDVRFFLNGMLLEVGPDYVRSVATDGHRMAMFTLKGIVGAGERRQVILPRKGVLELARLLDGSENTCQFVFGKSHVSVSIGGYTLTTKLVDGQFPDYEKVIPKSLSRSFVGSRETLKDAFSRVAILSNEKYRGVRLKLEPELLTVQANNPEQEEAEEVVAVQYEGAPVEIGFNVAYLLDVMNVLGTPDVKFGISDANSSALIESPGHEDAVYVVMPMRL